MGTGKIEHISKEDALLIKDLRVKTRNLCLCTACFFRKNV